MAKTKLPLKSTTRTFDTAYGTLTYPELSDKIAPNLLKLLDDIADGKYDNKSIDEDLILSFHFTLIGDVMPDIAGKWRKKPVQVGNWFPPEPFEVPLRMREFLANLQTRIVNAKTLERQIETLSYAEGEFLNIHPFQDFNGRTSRVLLTELLRRFDLPPVDVSVPRATPLFREYQDTLARYDNGDISGLIEFWKQRLSHG